MNTINTNKKIPQCIGVIMDGNRRWAREQGLPTLEGHRRGYEKCKELFSWASEAGVANVIVYAFSTENWKREQEEVSYLMDIFRTAIAEFSALANKENRALRFIGQTERFPADIQEMAKKAETDTKHFTSGTFGVAFSYGGRAEILEAVKSSTKGSAGVQSEEEFADHLWTAGIPDPDLIIRTGGERRLSGFLTWQSVYSELFFIDTYWPAFSKEEFEGVLAEYSNRARRFGK